MVETLPSSVDVFIAGGGPAGLATAIAAPRHGLSVLVADGAATPIDKPCGEGLTPDRALGTLEGQRAIHLFARLSQKSCFFRDRRIRTCRIG